MTAARLTPAERECVLAWDELQILTTIHNAPHCGSAVTSHDA